MRNARVWHALLGVEKAVIEEIEFDEVDQLLVVQVRPARGATRRCGVCQRRCGRYDAGEGRRRWRALDLGTLQAVLESDAPRVSCPEHGPGPPTTTAVRPPGGPRQRQHPPPVTLG